MGSSTDFEFPFYRKWTWNIPNFSPLDIRIVVLEPRLEILSQWSDSGLDNDVTDLRTSLSNIAIDAFKLLRESCRDKRGKDGGLHFVLRGNRWRETSE
jgi:hypothetical protein